jgi:hypothetical protein
MNGYKILCIIDDDIIFNIAGKSQKASINDIQQEDNLNRIYRIQFRKAPKSTYLDHVLLAIEKRPDITLRFYGDYSEDLIDWDKLSAIKNLTIDLWNLNSLKGVSKLVNLKTLDITKQISSKVSLSILEPLKKLEILYTSISKDIEAISNLEELNTLTLREIKSNDLDFLVPLSKLETLYLSLGSFQNFDGIKKIKGIAKMDIHQVRGFNNDVTENVVIHCKTLKALKLDNLKHITCLKFIKELSSLKYLSFEGVQNLETYDPILENKSLESFSGYKCQPSDKSLNGLRNLKNIRLGDSYKKEEIDRFLIASDVNYLNIRGKVLKGNLQTEDPFS